MQKNQSDGGRAGAGTLLLVCAIFVIAFFAVLWNFKHRQTCVAVLGYSYWIVWPYAKLSELVGWHNSPPITLVVNIVKASRDVSLMTLGDVMAVLNKSGLYALPLLLLPIRSALAAHRHPIIKCRQIHTSRSLIETQAKNNPCIYPVVAFENYWRKVGEQRPKVLGRSRSPDEFASLHGLIKTSGGEITLDGKKAIDVFRDQLGQRFDPKSAPAHYRALASIFMTRILGRNEKSREDAQRMLDGINFSCNPLKPPCFDFSAAAERFEQMIKSKEIQKIIKYHGYEKTFLMRLLSEARKDGKVPCSHFVWLKMIDRPLWYALHSVTPNHIARNFVEGAGSGAQYLAEIMAEENSMALVEDHLDEILPALEKRLMEANAITEMLYVDNGD